MIIDTHCHLTDKKFAGEVEEVIKRASEVGVEKIIVPSVDLADAVRAIELAEKYRGVYALVGVHPELAIKNPELEVGVDELVELVESSDKVVGIGEIGLDFYWDKEKKSQEAQMELFKMQLQVAEAMRLPVAVHLREAEMEIVEVLEQMEHLPNGQFHCWSGSEELLRWVLEKGFYVSFCGNVTWDERLQRLARGVPANRLLLETDAPYLAPGKLRGERNEPKNVKMILAFLADLLGKSENELAEQTSQNADRLFSI